MSTGQIAKFHCKCKEFYIKNIQCKVFCVKKNASIMMVLKKTKQKINRMIAKSTEMILKGTEI